jgi:hypothetical protein
VATVVLPMGDDATRKKVEGALDKLPARIARLCPDPLLAAPAIDACGDDAGTVAGCLECSQWRRAVGSLKAAYGSNAPAP